MTSKQSKPLLSFASDRALGLFGLVVGVIGLVLTVVIYFISIAEPALTIVVNPARTSILKNGETTKLRVQFDGAEIRGNLAAAQVFVWNAGRKAIRGDEVLEPIVIRTTDGSRILETQLTKVSRKVNGISVSPLSNRPDSVQLNFEVLERYDGAVLNIIYEGDSKVGFTADGQILGQKEVNDATYGILGEDRGGEHFLEGKWTSRLRASLWSVGAFVAGLLVVPQLMSIRREGLPVGKWQKVRFLSSTIFVLILVLTLISAVIWVLFLRETPPF